MHHLKGIPLSPGIAIGPLFCLKTSHEAICETSIADDEVESEIELYRMAIMQVTSEIVRLQARFHTNGNHEGIAILEGYLHILNDPLIVDEVIEDIRNEHKSAEFLFHRSISNCQKRLMAAGNNYFKERVRDLKDIEQRLLHVLKGSKQLPRPTPPPDAILFTKELSLSDIAEESQCQIQGFVAQYGGATSHAAIVLQAKGIPLISSIDFAHVESYGNSIVIMDGTTGDIFIDPDADMLRKYARKPVSRKSKRPERQVFKPVETRDGHTIRLSANMEMMHDFKTFQSSGASGIGLFRSEYLFITRDTFPSEEDQFVVYREIMDKVDNAPVVMRIFDFGGDKRLSCHQMPHEHNPFLGCRAIRLLLREQGLFKAQLKALVRAAEYGNMSILFPMISSLTELREAKKLLKEAQAEVGVTKTIPIGCMIEVPSAAIIADLLAKECDFLSIGTNDLVQYSLAVDRGNSLLGDLYSPSHPSIMRLIKFIVTAANKHGIKVSVCGEIAANPTFIPVLIGLGVHELSVALHNMKITRSSIRRTTLSSALKQAEKALQLQSGQAIEELLCV
jgi:phosphotransferase system enzyme I (PtsI)